MSHSPAPWTIEYEDEDGVPYDNGVRIDSPEGPVAFNVIDCSAPLIAAAPELLAACRAVIDNWENGDLAAAARQCTAAVIAAEDL